MEYAFSNPIFEWRGPAPFYFLELPGEVAGEIANMAAQLTYGWGVIPVTATIGATEFTTSLIPKNGGYLLPLKDAVRKPENLQVSDNPLVTLSLKL